MILRKPYAVISLEVMSSAVRNAADNSDYNKVKRGILQLAGIQIHTRELNGRYTVKQNVNRRLTDSQDSAFLIRTVS